MKNMKFLTVLILLFVISLSKAQLKDGDIAPNFTLTDIDGTSHTLYDYLDAGKSVVVDFSAVWCSPCWSYHEGHTLKNLYNTYGPEGSGTDEMMVFFIEADGSSTMDELNGNGDTQGDWVTGTPYPIILTDGSESVASDYKITAFPTLYYICPNRIIRRFYSTNETDIYNLKNTICYDNSYANDVYLFDFEINESGEYYYCSSDIDTKFNIVNMGSNTVASFDINAYIDGQKFATKSWTGSLSQYTQVNLTYKIESISEGEHTFQIKIENINGTEDEYKDNNNSEIKTMNMQESFKTMKIVVKTDYYPSEIKWILEDDEGLQITQDYGSITTINGLETIDQCINPSKCYDFHIYDFYSDGIAYQTTGWIKIKDEDYNVILEIQGDDYTDYKKYENICLYDAGIEDINNEEFVKVYPNPASKIINFYLPNETKEAKEITIYNNIGKMIYSDKFYNNKETISVDKFTCGMYFYKIKIAKKFIDGKFIVD